MCFVEHSESYFKAIRRLPSIGNDIDSLVLRDEDVVTVFVCLGQRDLEFWFPRIHPLKDALAFINSKLQILGGSSSLLTSFNGGYLYCDLNWLIDKPIFLNLYIWDDENGRTSPLITVFGKLCVYDARFGTVPSEAESAGKVTLLPTLVIPSRGACSVDNKVWVTVKIDDSCVDISHAVDGHNNVKFTGNSDSINHIHVGQPVVELGRRPE